MNRHARRKATKLTREQLLAIDVKSESDVDQCQVEGAVRVTVIKRGGGGITIYLLIDELPRTLAAVERGVGGEAKRPKQG